MEISNRFSPRRWVGMVAVPLAYVCGLHFNGTASNMLMMFLATSLAFFWAGLLWWPDFRRAELAIPSSWLTGLMFCFILYLLVMTPWSAYPALSFIYVWVVGSIPLWCLLWLKAPRQLHWDNLWRPLLFVQAGLLAFGIWEYQWAGRRANGPLLDPNAYAALVNLFFFPLLFRLLDLQAQKAAFWKKGIYAVLVIASIFALFASYSRGALLAWLLMLIPAVGVIIKIQGNRRLTAGAIFLTLALVTTSLFVTLYYQNIQPDRPSMFDLGQSSYQHRVYLSRSSWEIYKDHPWFGTGLNTFKNYYQAYRNPKEDSSAGFYVHNDYMQYLQDGGPILLLFLLLCGFASLQPTWRPILSTLISRDKPRLSSVTLEKIGLTLGLGALFIQASVNFIFYLLPHCIIAGLFIAQLHKDRITTEKTLSLPLNRSIAAILLLVLLALPIYSLSLSTISAMIIGRQSNLPIVRYFRDDFRRGAPLMEMMAFIQPTNNRALNTLARFYHELAVTPNGIGREERLVYASLARNYNVKALRNFPRSSSISFDLARLLIRFPELQESMPEGFDRDPEKLLISAIRYSPPYLVYYPFLAVLYEKRDEPEKAYAVLKSAEKWMHFPYTSKRTLVFILERRIKLALQLDQTEDAVYTAETLQQMQPDNVIANKVLRASQILHYKPKQADFTSGSVFSLSPLPTSGDEE